VDAHPFLAGLRRDLGRGLLPVWLLEELSEGETYDYVLLRRLSGRGGPGLPVTPSTLYPTLARMKSMGLIESFLGSESEGPVRKYYRLTPQGRDMLERARLATELLRSGGPRSVRSSRVPRSATGVVG
jgi:PadR family transcriptional regulator, regulatory protein PadR